MKFDLYSTSDCIEQLNEHSYQVTSICKVKLDPIANMGGRLGQKIKSFNSGAGLSRI